MKFKKYISFVIILCLTLINPTIFAAKDVLLINPDTNSYEIINENIPKFSKKDLNSKSYERYGKLDKLGRITICEANISKELMPTEKRKGIGMIKPTGWHTIKYDNISDRYLYNRCHLIGFQLTGENANTKNLMTGTRYFNVNAMLPFENEVAEYIRKTNNHVLYRATPKFTDDNLVADGLQLEALSIEDNGKGIKFNVFCKNIQPGITIDYKTGKSRKSDNSENTAYTIPNPKYTNSTKKTNNKTSKNNNSQNIKYNSTNKTSNVKKIEIRGNINSKIYHIPGNISYNRMNPKNIRIFYSEEDAKKAGYRPALR